MWNGISQFHDMWNLEYSTGIGIELAGTNLTSLRRNSTTLYVDTTRGGSGSEKKEKRVITTYFFTYMNMIVSI
jgi:hypothetical protein